MSHTQPDSVKRIIEEASAAYALYIQSASVNTDFAEFAALSYNALKSALGKPEMTQQQIRRILRKGHHSARLLPPENCWASHMAGYLSNAANTNIE